MEKKKLLDNLGRMGFSKKLISSFSKVKREDFIPEVLKDMAYEDIALPLFHNSAISQPSTIAFMLDLLELKGNEKILEIGSGSGYVLALLSHLTKNKIYGIEIEKALVEDSKKILDTDRISIYHMDGSQGLPKEAPFDRILLSAASTKVPIHLYPQLKNNGILVAPVLNSIIQVKKQNDITILKEYPGFVFVNMKKRV